MGNTALLPQKHTRVGNILNLLEVSIYEPNFERLVMEVSHIKMHPHAADALGGNQGMGRGKRDDPCSNLATEILYLRVCSHPPF